MIYFDFDGTLYEFDLSKKLDEVGKPEYPRQLQKHQFSILYAAQRLNQEYPGKVAVASAVLNDACKKAKFERITRDIGRDVANRSVFTAYGEDKAKAMDLKSNKRVGIKVYNGINGNHGTWKGFSIRADQDLNICYMQLKAILDVVLKDNEDIDILIDDFSYNLHVWEEAA